MTIVFQGKLFVDARNSTEEIIKNYLTLYPNLKIIISTWKSDTISDYLYDKCLVIRSDDPGSVAGSNDFKPNNVNRQIVSSINGIKKVKTKYVLKLRTDSYLNLDVLMQIFKKNSSNSEKVIISNLTSKNPRYVKNLYYHFCDWIYFGKTSEVIKFFDIPTYSISLYSDFNFVVAPEQHITFNWLINKNYIKTLKDIKTHFNIEAQEKIISEFLILTSPKEINLKSLKLGYKLMPFGKNGYISYTPYDIKVIRRGTKNFNSATNLLYRLRHYIQYHVIKLLLKIKVK